MSNRRILICIGGLSHASWLMRNYDMSQFNIKRILTEENKSV